jgi:hypothetical protein
MGTLTPPHTPVPMYRGVLKTYLLQTDKKIVSYLFIVLLFIILKISSYYIGTGVWGKASAGCGLFREVADCVGVTSPP